MQGYGDATTTAGPFHHKPTNATSPTPPKTHKTFFFNCTVFTSDPSMPYASSFIVEDNKFYDVFDNNTIITNLEEIGIEANDTVIDLKGSFVTPGFIDAHVHLIPGGMSLSRLDLRSVDSKEGFIHAVHAAVEQLTPGEWLLGSNWDESKWGGESPKATWIDSITRDNPVFLIRLDAHQGLANSLAMEKAGITTRTHDPPGGVIIREESIHTHSDDHHNSNTDKSSSSSTPRTHPTGLFTDAAQHLITRFLPKATVQQRTAAVLAAQQHLLSLGVTSVHDMGRVAFLDGEDAAVEDLLHVYSPMADRGLLKIRLRSFVPLSMWRHVAEMVKHIGDMHRSGFLSWGGVKEFYDGSLGSRTALMHEAYANDAITPPSGAKNTLFGTRTVERQKFLARLHSADAAGLQIAVHAIGDRAVDEVIDAFEGVFARNSDGSEHSKAKTYTNNHRHRIEHAQHLSDPRGVSKKLSSLNMITTPNPLHRLADREILSSRVGKERSQRAYAFRTMLEHGVMCAYASDWPVVPIDPLETIKAAVVVAIDSMKDSQRRGNGGGGGGGGGGGDQREEKQSSCVQCVSVEAAVIAQTRVAAFAGIQENMIGSIKEGLYADFVVLDKSIVDHYVVDGGGSGGAAPRVLRTYVNGVCEYGCAAAAAVDDDDDDKNEIAVDSVVGDGGETRDEL